MTRTKIKPYLAGLCAILLSGPVTSHAVQRFLPYQEGDLDADAIIDQVYSVNHLLGFRNVASEKVDKQVTHMITLAPGDQLSFQTMDRYLNNEYDDGVIRTKDLLIFRSGKLKGTGYLITHYLDEEKTPSYIMWLPELRKVRRFAAPSQADVCCGANLSYGDLFMRRPIDETHELIGKEKFDGCMGTIQLRPEDLSRYLTGTPEAECGHQGKPVYVVRSTSKFRDWWYDYRVSYIDAKTFGDYRIRYFKDGQEIKVWEKNWQSMGHDDPRHQYLDYWYVRHLVTGIESMIVVPRETVKWDAEFKSSLWTESTLRKLKR